ncbi:hypothetical protein [Streptomyces sp. NPDC058683]|uniref:hypothetical protein n=1 Tax=Streptomyces sp. NPDC058683 TaxID=3346597 RepID=UPI003655B699
MYDEIGKVEDSTPDLMGQLPEHGMTFLSPDETELVSYRVEGLLPVPASGDVIGLHWSEVVVTALQTRYGRDETTGRPLVFTSVSVEALPSATA